MIKSLTNIGLKDQHGYRERRVIQITNVLSVAVGIILIPLAVLNLYIGQALNAVILFICSLIYILNLYWNKLGFYTLSKLVLVFVILLNPFIHIAISNKTPDGQYLSYLIISIILVTTSSFLFSSKKDRPMYYFCLVFNILWMVFIDFIVYSLSNPKPNIDFLLDNYYFYKAPPIAAVLIISFLIAVYNGIINKYEEENENAKLLLSKQNEQLASMNGALEDRVREKTSKLVETNDKIIQLAFMTSHELRGPLASILGFTKFFKGQNSLDDASDYLDKLHDKAEEMDSVINKMTKQLEDMPDPRKLK